jgi:hypothetical protein
MSTTTDSAKTPIGNVIYKFPVLHHGWEGDEWGYIVEKDGTREVWLSDHNKFYIASVKELEQKLAEYTTVTFDTKKAITLLTTYGKLD